MSSMNHKADFFFNQAGKWQEAVEKLRVICLDCNLDEEVKWGCPCYSLDGINIVLIHHFKDYCALLLFKGALLRDPEGILVQQTKNVQGPRQLRFTGAVQIAEMADIIKSYIHNEIEVEKAGLKVEMKKTDEFEMPEEFKSRLNHSKELKAAFEKLTPGRQRGYLLYFAQAKQTKTREARIDKYIPNILAGKGVDD